MPPIRTARPHPDQIGCGGEAQDVEDCSEYHVCDPAHPKDDSSPFPADESHLASLPLANPDSTAVAAAVPAPAPAVVKSSLDKPR